MWRVTCKSLKKIFVQWKLTTTAWILSVTLRTYSLHSAKKKILQVSSFHIMQLAFQSGTKTGSGIYVLIACLTELSVHVQLQKRSHILLATIRNVHIMYFRKAFIMMMGIPTNLNSQSCSAHLSTQTHFCSFLNSLHGMPLTVTRCTLP